MTLFWKFLAFIVCQHQFIKNVKASQHSIKPGFIVNGGNNCGFRIDAVTHGGKIKSPNYPNTYPDDSDCHWHLSANEPIILSIVELDIEEHYNCSYDFLEIYAGDTPEDMQLIHRLCGSKANYLVKTNSTAVHLFFNSDLTFQGTGFEILYTLASNRKQETSCTTSFYEIDGVISSPGYPNRYPINVICRYNIEVELNDKIFLTFSDFNLEKDHDCKFDFLEIFDGSSRNSVSFGKFCNEIPDRIASSGNQLLLQFYSDNMVTRKGFLAKYSTKGFVKDDGTIGDCIWEKTDQGGRIASPGSPGSYPSSSYCKIQIDVPQNRTLKFIFQRLALEISENCQYDYVSIEHQTSTGEAVVERFCGKFPDQIITSSNSAMLTFQSDSSVQLKGFEVFYIENQLSNRNEKGAGKRTSKRFSGGLFLRVSPDANVRNGSKHAISCIPVDANNTVTWFKEAVELRIKNLPAGLFFNEFLSTLVIQKMNIHHVGNYSCLAISEDYGEQREFISITMYNDDHVCDIDLHNVPKDITVTEGIEHKALKCNSKNPDVTISWMKDKVELNNNKKYQILPNRNLMLIDLEAVDEGLYSCVASRSSNPCILVASSVVTLQRRQNAKEVCGILRVDHVEEEIEGKIVGGSTVKPGSHPWQAMFWDPQLKSYCGGALLNDRWVASVAHCFVNANGTKKNKLRNVRVKLGKTRSNSSDEGEFITSIKEIVIHPNYMATLKSFENDLALVQLSRPVVFTTNILPICLGKPKFVDEVFFAKPNRLGSVTGWGLTKESGQTSTFLKEVQLPLVHDEICRNSTSWKVTKNMFCAGFSQEILNDACQGDSGGPFAMEHEGIRYLIGLVSWGEGCARKGKYGFYTKISTYYNWIVEITALY